MHFVRTNFLRDLLNEKLPARAACYGVPTPHDPVNPAAGALFKLRDLLGDPALFASAIGDILVIGGGLWNLAKDWHTYPRPNHWNGHKPRYNTTAALVAAYVREVRDVAAVVSSQPEPWRSALASRIVWRGMFATESGPEFPGQHNHVVATANAAAAGVWAGLGVPAVDVFKYVFPLTRPEDGDPHPPAPDDGASAVDWHEGAPPPPVRHYTYTRDSVHPLDRMYRLAVRDILSVVVRTAVRHGLAPFPDSGGGGVPVEGGPRRCRSAADEAATSTAGETGAGGAATTAAAAATPS